MFRKKKLIINEEELKWKIELKLRSNPIYDKLSAKKRYELVSEILEKEKEKYLNGK